jgi:xylan 1,4-beta-xylosidase
MSYTHLTPFKGNVGFNAHHSPMGAFFSFTCGHFNTTGGLAAQAGKPGNQDIFIGVKDGDRKAKSPLRCLPFFSGAKDVAADAFLVEQAGKAKEQPQLTAYSKTDIQRFYGWASDRWVTPDLQFTIYTPFSEIPDPQNATAQSMREALIPAVVAELTVDNTHGKTTKTALFALRFNEPGIRLIPDLGPGRLGFGLRRHLGVAGEMLDSNADTPAMPILAWAPDVGLAANVPVHHLGGCPGITFEVPAGQKRTLRLAFGCYLEGPVTTNLEASYFYTRYFGSLNDVLGAALDSYDMAVVRAAERDHELATSNLSPDQQFLLAHSTRSYYGSTQLLDLGGKPFWVVNEGEYCMLNTLDLSVDHVFWELRQNPWVIRNLLENFVKHYSFRDQVKVPDGKGGFKLAPAGISFCHDMGVHNNFSPIGTSSYEIAELDALCFSHMTQEQVCNWTLMAGCYVAATGDLDWLNQNAPIIRDCYLSMLARDHVDEKKRTGVMQLDSYRCGEKGSEITTYDSLDHSLAQSRNNLYIATKCWATYLTIAMMFQKLGKTKLREEAIQSAALAAKTVARNMGPDGFIPAVFEKGNPGHGSRILPAIEGLIYPLYWRSFDDTLAKDALDPKGRYAEMLTALKKHTQTLLTDPENRNRFPDGGIRLSSTSANSWMSKIALFQQICREYLGFENADARQVAADAAHVKWQTEGDSAYWAMSDQIVNGVAQGSKYYPRCVTTILWMK